MDIESRDHTQLLQGIWREIKVVHQSLGRRIDENTAKLGETNTRLDETNTRLDETNARLDENGQKIDETNVRLDQVNDRLDSVEARLEVMVCQQAMLNRYVRAVVDRHDTSLDLLDERVTRLETDRLPQSSP